MPIKLKHINWKYIFGEILLLFVGINLAIWFNEWNTSRSIEKNKEIALAKIKVEMESNLKQLVENHAENQKIPKFFQELNSLKNDKDELLLTPQRWNAFVDAYPDLMKTEDSVSVGNGKYRYEGDTTIFLELTDLSDIAWEISKSTGIFHEFGYDCLYQLQAIYHTQNLVKNELNKATEALGNKSIDDLIRVLSFMDQLETQLEDQYKDMIKSIDNCK
ncbi:hypothetical protein [Flagellimonas flava]|uniref:Uncharacterized protein n=1 Tax=Flagellimonas flava TaxID=570519 RepID=A0A1M5JVW4_9FLAO|nr:hypothetical protein [Allomuricauda flava]SHG44717.1 hypothetical protein SAMN04488116_1249 [Allomuricauda flava]